MLPAMMKICTNSKRYLCFRRHTHYSLLITHLLLLVFFSAGAQHPIAFATKTDFAVIKNSLTKYPVLRSSYEAMKKNIDNYLGKDVDVPVPKDPAGGYTHDRHKENYTLIFNAGLLYN